MLHSPPRFEQFQYFLHSLSQKTELPDFLIIHLLARMFVLLPAEKKESTIAANVLHIINIDMDVLR
jgi:hypothetical protein